MKTCPSCQTSNADSNPFCKQCGQSLPEPSAAPANATVRWSGQLVLPVQKTLGGVPLASLFGSKDRLVIGRAADCDVCLPHPMVSRYHALLERKPDGRLRNLASVNGVWVGGRHVTEPVAIKEGERVGIGPFLFTMKNGVIQSLDSSRSLRLEAHNLEKEVPLERGQRRKLLDNITLVLNPGEFVSLLDPSGSGKSTLMDCLNGRRRATGGQVLANGEDFYRHFDNFRQSLGYVPQRDIVHTQLTVYRALYYTARLRLPSDTNPTELSERIEAVLREMELGPHRETLVANLSGGQIKRVSLGAELLAQPCLLYIDEATSGLDAGTEARMMRLFRRLADEGRSLICITHNVDNVEQCHLALILVRGKLVYYGPPGEAPAYFGVSRISEVYDRLAEKENTEWEKQYLASSLYQEFVAKRLAAPTEPARIPTPVLLHSSAPPVSSPETKAPVETPPSAALSAPAAEPPQTEGVDRADRFRALTTGTLRVREYLVPIKDALHQFRVLTARYVELVLSDQRSLRLLLLQAPIVALFLLIGFFDKPFRGTVPDLKPLTEQDRKLLHALDAVNALINIEGEPGPDQRQALEKIKVGVALKDRTVDLNGLHILHLLQQGRQLSGSTNWQDVLGRARFTYADNGANNTVTLADLAEVSQQMRDTKLLDQLKDYQDPIMPVGTMVNPRYTYMLLFILVMIVLWFGCNNAAKEIVKEEAIYGRERAVNLGIVPYLASKFVVLSVITIFHALLLMVLLYGALHLLQWYDPNQYSVPYRDYMLSYTAQFGVLALLSMTGVGLGLLLSACVATPDRANTLLPYVLIPQMILGGGFLSVSTGILSYLAIVLSPVYWAYRAVHLGGSKLPTNFPGHVEYIEGAALPCKALLIQIVVLLFLTAWFLRRKDA